MNHLKNLHLGFVFGLFALLSTTPASALDLDWSGNFRADSHWVYNYTLDSTAVTGSNAGGYDIPSGGETNAFFQSFILRLRPTVIVNDNIYIKSEVWFGDPVYGLFGSGLPYSADQLHYSSNQSRGSSVTAQRVWAEILSDIGVVKVGRMPLHWGLGLVWNDGNDVWSRYMTTSDGIRLVSKFGAFSFAPSILKYSQGMNIGGGGSDLTPAVGSGAVNEYAIALKYENPDDQAELGVQFLKRIAGAAQDSTSGYRGMGTAAGASVGMNYNIWDIYAKKTWGTFTVGVGVPVVSGEVGGAKYSTYALALETQWKINDSFETGIRAGQAPGNPTITEAAPTSLKGFNFHPNYRLGLIMFNYQLRNFSGPNTLNDPTMSPGNLASPFYNPITNAQYLSWGGSWMPSQKWKFNLGVVLGQAIQIASAGNYFNHWQGIYKANTGGATQKKSLGWEMDWGLDFKWDEAMLFGLDMGLYFPGAFYEFADTTATANPISTMFATQFRVGITF